MTEPRNEQKRFKPVTLSNGTPKFKPVGNQPQGGSSSQTAEKTWEVREEDQALSVSFNDRPIYMLVFGLCFGFIAMIVVCAVASATRRLALPDESVQDMLELEKLLDLQHLLSLFSASLPAMVGFYVVSVGGSAPDGIMSGNSYQVVRSIVLTASVALLLFPIAVFIFAPVFTLFFETIGGKNIVDPKTANRLCNLGPLAICAGVTPGIISGHFWRFVLGGIGSFVGVVISVFVVGAFDVIGAFGENAVQLDAGLTVFAIGFMMELFVALAEDALKRGWLVVKDGRFKGKQFTLDRNPTMIGSSVKSHVFLAKDRAVAGFHAAIYRRDNEFALKPQAPTLINGKLVGDCMLRNNCVITVGQTNLVFKTKKVSGNYRSPPRAGAFSKVDFHI